MKAYLRTFFLVLVLLAVRPLAASAEVRPADDVLKEIIGKIKAKGDPSPVVEYVHWETAFKNATDDQKRVMNLKSPEDMKQIYKRMFESPSSVMKEKFAEQMKNVPPDKQQMMQQATARMQELMEQKENEVKERLKETEYKVGSASVEGNEAKVKLTQTYKTESKEDEVKFIKVDGQWLLPSPNIIARQRPENERAKEPAAASPEEKPAQQ